MKERLIATAISLMMLHTVNAAPLFPAQCTKSVKDCNGNIPCEEHLKKYNDCTGTKECKKAMDECKGDNNCLETLRNTAGCGADDNGRMD